MNETSQLLGEKAVVIGAGFSGLLAARVLSPYFRQVLILERDDLPTTVGVRRGVPQANHSHMLLCRGADILFELFPDIKDNCRDSGLNPLDLCNDFRWFHFGVWKLRVPSPLKTYLCDRARLEFQIRERLTKFSNIRIRPHSRVLKLKRAESSSRICGVVVGETNETVEADLVVDAAGVGSLIVGSLSDLGLPPVRETKVTVDVGYASRVYRLPPNASTRLPLTISPKPPMTRRMGIAYALDSSRMMVTLGGWLKDSPPKDEDGFLEFARSLGMNEYYELVRRAEPITAIQTYRFSHNRLRHFDRLTQWPGGLIVLGDAVCSFNPVYGQGMTVSALEVEILRGAIESAARNGISPLEASFCRSFQKKLRTVVATPWMLATSEDLRFPQAVGPRPFGLPVLHWYTASLLELSSCDPFVLRRFLEVMSFLRHPASLFHPKLVTKVITWRLRRRESRMWNPSHPIPDLDQQKATRKPDQILTER